MNPEIHHHKFLLIFNSEVLVILLLISLPPLSLPQSMVDGKGSHSRKALFWVSTIVLPLTFVSPFTGKELQTLSSIPITQESEHTLNDITLNFPKKGLKKKKKKPQKANYPTPGRNCAPSPPPDPFSML